MSPGRSARRWWPCTHCHRLVLSTATSDREPTGTMKNRMRELRSFGSVRGEGSDVLAYSENRPEAVTEVGRVATPKADVRSALRSALRGAQCVCVVDDEH